VSALEHDAAGFEYITVIAAFECLGNALLDHDQSDLVFAVQGRDPVENQIGDRRRKAHRGFVEEKESGRRGDAATDRQYLLLARRDRRRRRVGRAGGPGVRRVRPKRISKIVIVVVHSDSGGCASNHCSTTGSTATRIIAESTLVSTRIIRRWPALPGDHAFRNVVFESDFAEQGAQALAEGLGSLRVIPDGIHEPPLRYSDRVV
jgi:hypothetical protein